MRLLLINPNTTAAITDRVVEVARAAVTPDTELVGITGRFGARYIASRSAYAVAGHAALDAWANADPAHDAVVLACFGDPGLDGLRELSPKPVVGLAEASIHAACLLGRRFAIVTGGERWVAMLEEFVAARGLASKLAGVLAVPQTGAAIAEEPEAALQGLAACCNDAVDRLGADVVILGGAGLAGLADRLSERVAVPLVDCVVAGVLEAQTLAALQVIKATTGSFARPAPVASVGLSKALERRLEV
jgi:allantoin racemase